MDIVIFILVLVALIVVHEFGHFIAAKLSGMRVDEFGIGYPPRAVAFARRKETVYTLNWLPFGGFVRIFGEDLTEEGSVDPRAFSAKPRILQAVVLLAGIAMNLLFAWILLSTTLALGAPRALSPEQAAQVPGAALTITSVLPGSPAETAGVHAGDTIVRIEGSGGTYEGADAGQFVGFVSKQEAGTPLSVTVKGAADAAERVVEVTPRAGIAPGEPARLVLGVGLATIGTVRVPVGEAPFAGAAYAYEVTKSTALGLIHFFAGLFTLSADLSQVAGPVGIAGAVGDASAAGLVSLLSITALISINLALINLLPIPALDGGRLLFVIIEAVIRKPIKPMVANAFNTAGFALLILLMLVVTAHDIFKIAG